MQLFQIPSWFEQQRQWRELKASSQALYTILLRQGIAAIGPDREVNSITAKDADSLYLYLLESTSAHKANAVCSVLRRVWHVLQRHRFVDFNPFERMDLTQTARRTTLWTSEQVDDFIAASISYGLPSIGLLLHLCYTFAQRPGDVRQWKWDYYYEHGIHFKQEKTGKELHLFVPPFMQDDLDLVERLGPFIVTREDTHNPFTQDDYAPIFRAVKKLALLPKELQLRDARRSALTELEESGATDGEMQAVGGHDQRSTLNVYTVSSLKTSRNAMNKRFRR